jgi:hypothetical protein
VEAEKNVPDVAFHFFHRFIRVNLHFVIVIFILWLGGHNLCGIRFCGNKLFGIGFVSNAATGIR